MARRRDIRSYIKLHSQFKAGRTLTVGDAPVLCDKPSKEEIRRKELDELNEREDRYLRKNVGIDDAVVRPKVLAMGVSPAAYHATVMNWVRRYDNFDVLGIVPSGINGTTSIAPVCRQCRTFDYEQEGK
jgi:hypothetical protein